MDFNFYYSRAPIGTTVVNFNTGKVYVYERNACRCASKPESDYSLIDYYLYDIGCDFC